MLTAGFVVFNAPVGIYAVKKGPEQCGVHGRELADEEVVQVDRQRRTEGVASAGQ